MGGFVGKVFGVVVVFDGFGADSFFGDEFHGGTEEVVPKVALWPKESHRLSIEVIEESDNSGVI